MPTAKRKPICKTCRTTVFAKEDRWWPPTTDQIQVTLGQRIVAQYGISNSKELIKTLSYNLQYLHFLEETYHQTYHTSVLATMFFKSYVITSVSVIEVLLFCFLKEKKLYRSKMKKKLDLMIEKAKATNAWNKYDDWYDELNRLRKLRNSVHINITDICDGNTEYWKFNYSDYESAKNALSDVLHELFDSKQYKRYVDDNW